MSKKWSLRPGWGPSLRCGSQSLPSAGEKHSVGLIGGLRGKSQSKEPERPLPPLGPVAVDPKGCVTIAIHAKPGSKQNAVTDVTAEAVSVAIAAPPSEGEANAELCRYLSKVLELRKSDVVLDKGGKSREKVVKLLASTTAEEILEKLKQQVEKK
uniref:Chromosome 15 open reading frame 40 n=1 Tax=Ursus maritimus TaxID=29073 RepID=A0A452TZU6_URSMA